MEDLGEVVRDAAAGHGDGGLHLGIGPEIRARPSPRTALSSEARKRPEPPTEASEEERRRESLVPKGTFATAQGEAAAVEPAAPVETAAAPARARAEPSPTDRAARADATTLRVATGAGSSAPRKARIAPPPYLASAILREDLTPTEPGKQTLARTLVLGGALGLLVALLIPGGAATLVFASLFVALLALSRIGLPYVARAAAAGSVAGVGLFAATFWRVSLGGTIEGPFLSASITLLSAALLLRAWYRASAVARFLVGAALVLSLSWAALMSSRGLLELGFEWHSWLPALTWYLFVILCLLSLLAYMGDETTGGCDAWATGLFAWFGLHALVRYASEPAAPPSQALLGLVEPILSACAAVCLAQLLARALSPRARRVEQALTS